MSVTGKADGGIKLPVETVALTITIANSISEANSKSKGPTPGQTKVGGLSSTNSPGAGRTSGFPAGYMNRIMPSLAMQGDQAPWLNTQNYALDKKLYRKSPVDDGVMEFTTAKR